MCAILALNEDDRGAVAARRDGVDAVRERSNGRSRRQIFHAIRGNRIALPPLRRMRKLRDHRPQQGDALFHIARIDVPGLKPARRSLVLG